MASAQLDIHGEIRQAVHFKERGFHYEPVEIPA